MLGIDRIIRNLDDLVYQDLRDSLHSSKAAKFLFLLESFRNNKDESEIVSSMNITRNAYNVLKSRLYEKIQKHLITRETKIDNELLLQTFRIPSLIFSSDKQTALTVLDGLEKEFAELDLFEFLILISSARKRIMVNTPRYYEYSKSYNKYVALHLSLQKAEDELLQFNLVLSNYYLSRDTGLLDLLKIYRSEIEQIARIQNSPKFNIIRHIVNASLLIFAPATIEDRTLNTEAELKACVTLINSIPRDLYFRYYLKAAATLYFFYYSSLGLYVNADSYFIETVKTGNDLINFYPLLCTISYPESKILTELKLGKKVEKIEWTEPSMVNPASPEFYSKISVFKHNAVVEFIHKNPLKGLEYLKTVLNDMVLKDLPLIEIEFKFLYLLMAMEAKKEGYYESVMNSLTRKVREIKKSNTEFDIFTQVLNLFKLSLGTRNRNTDQSIIQKLDEVKRATNHAHSCFLQLVKVGIFDKTFIKAII